MTIILLLAALAITYLVVCVVVVWLGIVDYRTIDEQ